MTVVHMKTGELDRLFRAVEAAVRFHALGDKRDVHVYFIQQGAHGPVKIGASSDVLGRLRALQTANSEPLRIIGVWVLGGFSGEARLHKLLAADRLAGEWFRPSEDVYDWAREMGWAA